jgi:Flp pilus assembly protein TadB|tara:strand:- start:625 stop:984 length:360 start_codon:yes stop_codon:yes gene_type:complete
MFAGSLVLGITLIAFAWWLHCQDTQGWPSDNFTTDLDKTYHQSRTRSRRRIHVILSGCGVAAIIAAFYGLGTVWVAMWSFVMVSLLVVVGLAGVDALRTHRYMKSKLPEIRERLLNDDE